MAHTTRFIVWFAVYWLLSSLDRALLLHFMGWDKYTSEYSSSVRLWSGLINAGIFFFLWFTFIAEAR